MIVSAELQRRYDMLTPWLAELRRRVSATLTPYVQENRFLFDDRRKTVQSLAEKLESGRYTGISEVDDIYACTLVVPTVAHEESVLSYLATVFRQLWVKPRGSAPKDPTVFRFDSPRFVGTLSMPADAPSADSPLYRLRFEVQVQSLFEFAWTRATHAIAYKTAVVDWRRWRVAAQLKATVEQIDQLLVGFDDALERVGDGSFPYVTDQARIREHFAGIAARGKIPSEICPKDWSRFADNVYRFIQALHGAEPTGRSSRPLKDLNALLAAFSTYVDGTPPDRFPRGIPLFQTVVGVLATLQPAKRTMKHYHLLIDPDFARLFQDARHPAEPLSMEGDDQAAA